MTPEPAQPAYARVVAAATAAGLAALLLAFVAYVTGVIEARVPAAEMARWWSMSAAELRARSGAGWGREAMAETLVLLGVAWLATCSILGLAAAAARFLAARERLAAALAMLQVGVLVAVAAIPFIVRW